MSKLYAVVQVCPERHYDYKMDMIRESFSVGLPFVFSDRKRAYQEAEKKRKAHVPCFVNEFPFNPLDKRLETLEAKAQADAKYIGDLEQSVNYYGNDVNFEAAVELMDKDICEQLHDQMAPCTEQEFFDAYAKAHAEKFDGEEFAPYYNLAW